MVYLCGTKYDLVEENKKLSKVDFSTVREYTDGMYVCVCGVMYTTIAVGVMKFVRGSLWYAWVCWSYHIHNVLFCVFIFSIHHSLTKCNFLCTEIRAKYMDTSAKTGHNIGKGFSQGRTLLDSAVLC